MSNRTAQLRACLHLYVNNADTVPLHISGPNAGYGVDGEVSYTFMFNGCLNDRDARECCETIERNVPDVHRAYVTKRMDNGWGQTVGGNIKVVFKTRADGRPAKAGERRDRQRMIRHVHSCPTCGR